MSNKLKLKHQLFIGKLIDKYGAFPIKLILKEAYKAIDEIHPKNPYICSAIQGNSFISLFLISKKHEVKQELKIELEDDSNTCCF
jgi:hypothetical protein